MTTALPVAQKAKAALQQKNGNGNGGTAVAKTSAPQNLMGLKSNQVAELFNLYRSQIAAVIPSIVTPERLIQVATSLVTRTPEIASCTTGSIIGALMQCAILGLDMSPSLQYAYFVPYKNTKTQQKEVQFQIGYRGLLALLRRTGQVETAYAYVVYQNDKFNYELGLEPRIYHKPAEKDRGELIYAYAVIKFKEGGMIFEVMSKADIEHIREKSQSFKTSYSPWKTDPGEMWRKTVLKRLCKYAPVSIEDAKGLALEQQLSADEGIIDANKIDLTTKELPVEHVDYTDVTESEPDETEQKTEPEPENTPAQQQESEKPVEKPVDKKNGFDKHKDFLDSVENLKNSIKKLTGGDEQPFLRALGVEGFTTIEEVPATCYSRVIKAIAQEFNDLKKK